MIIILFFVSFSCQRLLLVFHWGLSDSKSPQISRTLLSILSDLNNVVMWIFSACPSISNSWNPFTKLLMFVPSAGITIGITVTFMFHSLFSSLTRSKFLPLLSFSLIFHPVAHWVDKVYLSPFFSFWSGLLTGIRWSVRISKSQTILRISFSRADSRLFIYHLAVWSNFKFLHYSHWITFSPSCDLSYTHFALDWCIPLLCD